MMKAGIERNHTPALTAFCALLCIALCLIYPSTVLEAARTSFELFCKSVLPALFPCFVLTSVLAKTGVLSVAGAKLAPLMGRLGLPGETGLYFLLGGVSGYPVGAKLASSLADRPDVSPAAFDRICAACNMASPMFISGTIAASVLNAPQIGWALLLSHWLGSLFLLVVPALFCRRAKGKPLQTPGPAPAFRPLDSVLGAVSEGMSAMLRVCGSLMLFAVIASLFETLLPFVQTGLQSALVTGFFEKTAGCSAIAALSLSLPAKAALCSLLLSFGGCSVLLQTLFFAGVNIRRYWGYKLAAGVVSALITYALLL